MEKIKEILEKKIDKKIIYFLFPILIIIAKIIRYTLMKEVLVDTSIGYSYLSWILNDNVKFELLNGNKNAALFFDILNIFNFTTYIQFEIYISIIWNIILFFIIFKLNKKLDIIQMLFIIMLIAVLNIFDFCLAKEPIQMLFFVAIYLVICNQKLSFLKKNIFITLILLVTAIVLRNYYVLIAGFFVLINIIYFLFNKFNIKRYRLLIGFVCVILSIIALLIFSYFFMPSQYELLSNVKIYTSNAATDIHSISENLNNPNIAILVIDYIIEFIRLLFPFELMFIGIKYYPYILFQLIITYYFIKSIIFIEEKNKSEKIAIFLCLAFFIGSAMFEPDFGSWIRHEAVFFPILFIICKVKELKSNEEKNDLKKEEQEND